MGQSTLRRFRRVVAYIVCKVMQSIVSQVEQDILDNLEWQAKKSSEEVRAGRESVLEKLEWASAQQRESGALDRWWLGVDPEIRQVAGKCIACRSLFA